MKQLHGITILITRDAAQAGSLKEQLEEKGATVVCVPTISIGDPPDWIPFDRASEELERFDWIIFSSVNAVIQTIKRLRHNQIEWKDLDLPATAAVGDQTAQSLKENGWEVTLIPDRFQAEDLGSSMIARGVEGKKVWLPRALKARNILVELLEKAGAEVLVTPVYQNSVPLENREKLHSVLKNSLPDWITFTSSSTVDNFFKILGENIAGLKLPKIASIGRVTSETLQKYSLQPVFTADPQNLEGLCGGIIRWETEKA